MKDWDFERLEVTGREPIDSREAEVQGLSGAAIEKNFGHSFAALWNRGQPHGLDPGQRRQPLNHLAMKRSRSFGWVTGQAKLDEQHVARGEAELPIRGELRASR